MRKAGGAAVADPALRLRGLERRFGNHLAVAGIDLDVAPGEFVTLLGPSGCGKTTTLNLIAGFIQPSAGSIALAGQEVAGLPPFRRDLGVVFQDYALFPHMTVAENVGFGLRMRGVPRAEIVTRVTEALGMVRLEGLGARRPGQLSGGQRQRVALARALVIRPRMLLLDEPLSNLDLKLREEMRLEITALQRRLGIATVFVTHDQGEALAMSDRIAVMRAGRIEQIGAPTKIYARPATRFVAEFIGSINILSGISEGPGALPGTVLVRTGLGLVTATTDRPLPSGTTLELAVRPERMLLGDAAPQPGDTMLRARVETAVYVGARTELRLAAPGGIALIAEATDPPGQGFAVPGAEIAVTIRATDLRALPGAATSGKE
ncbi:ABC transporter ATP-binding protein [Muricoccus radiodurans]|uniref:ABC transporter ATP-binding protein n=1 Tax=Muricoccus radiodurans TaxID=2231721 RepID=UPI003CFA45BD